jgi:hypothetical protein
MNESSSTMISIMTPHDPEKLRCGTIPVDRFCHRSSFINACSVGILECITLDCLQTTFSLTETSFASMELLGSRSSCLSFLPFLLVASCWLGLSEAALSCDSNEFCKESLNHTESVCLPSGSCSNPFQRGCLQSTLLRDSGAISGEHIFLPQRVCNSDDAINNDLCKISDFDGIYPELRIHHADWTSNMFQAWIYQIMLMEVLGVPTTVGLTTQDTPISSFYSKDNTLEFSPETYPYHALSLANRVHDCALTEKPCAHVLPEVWNGQMVDYIPLVLAQTLEPTGNGMVGMGGFYIPAFTAKEHQSLVIYYALQGEDNRQKLAQIFKRPTTWLDYCQQVSTTNCSRFPQDTTASRFPYPDEEDVYFAEGVYTGHFRATDKNDCETNPASCTGHIISPPCQWSEAVAGQLYWNDIVGLEQDGPLAPNGGYGYSAMREIWMAANATTSHVLMYWYQPDDLIQQFFGSKASFQQILLPAPTGICLENRPDLQARCSDDIQVRRGDPVGACDYQAQALQRLIAKSVGDNTAGPPKAEQSPAYEFIRNFKISENDMNSMITNWLQQDVDRFGNDAREAVCNWVVENLNTLEGFIPPGYPRKVALKSEYDAWYLHLAQALGVFAEVLCLAAIAAVLHSRKTKVMVFAQPFFLLLILTGFSFISMGAILIATTPTQASCRSLVWFIVLGYSVRKESRGVEVIP